VRALKKVHGRQFRGLLQKIQALIATDCLPAYLQRDSIAPTAPHQHAQGSTIEAIDFGGVIKAIAIEYHHLLANGLRNTGQVMCRVLRECNRVPGFKRLSGENTVNSHAGNSWPDAWKTFPKRARSRFCYHAATRS
jgi:hypothetical protein